MVNSVFCAEKDLYVLEDYAHNFCYTKPPSMKRDSKDLITLQHVVCILSSTTHYLSIGSQSQ